MTLHVVVCVCVCVCSNTRRSDGTQTPTTQRPPAMAVNDSSRPVACVLVRHGITVSQTGGPVLRDDALSEQGIAGAAALVGHPALAPVSLAFVSPLRRALNTALLAMEKRCAVVVVVVVVAGVDVVAVLHTLGTVAHCRGIVVVAWVT